MLRYVLRRFLLLFPMVLAASVFIFLMLRLGTGRPALDYLRRPPAADAGDAGLDPHHAGTGSAAVRPSTAPGRGRRCILTSVSHSPANARYWTSTLSLPARHAGTCRCGAGINSSFLNRSDLGGAPPRPSAGFRRTFHRVLGVSMPNFWLAFLLVMAFSGVSAMATRDGLRRLAAHHFAGGFHCLYVAGD